MSINRWIGVGRLTKEPSLSYTPSGVAVCNFSLAVNRPFTNQQGEREADFFNIIAWRKQAENVAAFLQKGNLCGIDGRLQSRSYENNQGQRVFVTEVVAEQVQFLEPKRESRQSGGNPNRQNGAPPQNDDPFSYGNNPINISDDDLPF